MYIILFRIAFFVPFTLSSYQIPATVIIPYLKNTVNWLIFLLQLGTFGLYYVINRAFQVTLVLKKPPANEET